VPLNFANLKRKQAAAMQSLLDANENQNLERNDDQDGIDELYMSDEEVEERELARLSLSSSDLSESIPEKVDFFSASDSIPPSRATLSPSSAISPDALSIPITNHFSRIKSSSKKMPRSIQDSGPSQSSNGDKRRRKGGKTTEYIDRIASASEGESRSRSEGQREVLDDEVEYVTETRWDRKKGGEFERTKNVRVSRGRSRGDWQNELGW